MCFKLRICVMKSHVINTLKVSRSRYFIRIISLSLQRNPSDKSYGVMHSAIFVSIVEHAS